MRFLRRVLSHFSFVTHRRCLQFREIAILSYFFEPVNSE